MSLFKKLFGGKKSKEKPELDSSKFKQLSKTDFKSLDEMVEQNAGLSFEKQLVFRSIIGSSAWQLDMNEGIISFGDLIFPIQIIGSLAFDNNSWMWGWANTQSGMPDNLLIQSNELKRIGQEKSIKELEEGHFNVEKGFEHKIGLMTCGIFQTKSYYCANYGQGTLVVTIDNNKIPAIDFNSVEKVLTTFPQLTSKVELHHKNAFLNYLIDRKFKIDAGEKNIKGLKNNTILVAEFDELERMISLNAKI